jgi:hypothetical protein
MIYRVTNKRMGPTQLALASRDGNGTKLIVLPWKKTYDIPEEMYSEQIDALCKKGDVVVEKIYKKR